MANLMGYIKLYRSLLESPIFDNEKLLKVFIWCLLKASHKEYKAVVGTFIVPLEPGQFIYGGRKAAEELGIPYTTLNRYMHMLVELETISLKVERKYTVVSVANWALYQSDTKKVEHKWNVNGTKTDTYNNGKNGKKKAEAKKFIKEGLSEDEIARIKPAPAPSCIQEKLKARRTNEQ